jgi:phytanoyl-CoA hydroxylase
MDRESLVPRFALPRVTRLGLPARTVDNAARGQFDHDGYCVLPGLLSPAETAELRRHLHQILNDAAAVTSSLPSCRFSHDKESFHYVQGLERADPFFAQFLGDARFAAAAALLLGCAVRPLWVHFRNSVISFAGVSQHQDCSDANLDTRRALSFWVSLGDYDKDSGCLYYLPGSHLEGFRPDLAESVERAPLPEPPSITVETRDGDVLCHHWFTVHGSRPNHAATERWAVMLCFCEATARFMPRAEWVMKYSPR